ncbi:MAG TPA: cyclic nucleotide-binding domain-containing protein [bacterium]|nr:cyclic nucleotide-binding domain-containing protein [bacterium]HPN31055.1 cyclic nucleotide-binding domain-containing protein [bacterium]
MIDIHLLKNINIFSDLTEDDLTKICGIVEEQSFPENFFIFREGDRGHEMFLIVSGSVEISRNIVADKRKPIVTLHRGQFFGEMTLFDEEPRSANVMTMEKSLFLKITKKSFSNFLELNPVMGFKIYKRFVHELCSRVRITDDKIQERIFWGFVSKTQ